LADYTSEAVHRYFELSLSIEQHKADGNFAAAIAAARQTYRLLPAFVRAIPDAANLRAHAVHTTPTLMAVLEDEEAIDDLRSSLEGIPELHGWMECVDAAKQDLALVHGIMREIAAAPGMIQTMLKSRLGVDKGQDIAQLVRLLEKAKRVRRLRKGSSYLLHPYDQVPSSAPFSEPKTPGAAPVEPRSLLPRVKSSRRAIPPTQLDISNVPLVRLPMAPSMWAERRRQTESAPRNRATVPPFDTDGEGWEASEPDKLPSRERPDPAFREAYHTGRSTFLLDPRGRTERFPLSPCILRVINATGVAIEDRGLSHDVYRADVNRDGSAILFLSRDGVLHAYSDDLSPLFVAWLEDMPEYRAQADRLAIPAREMKNHTRCVSISTDHARYLVTVVDEAYCFDVASQCPLWSIRTPMQEGWARVAGDRSSRVGTDTEILDALRLMELQLPVSPEDLTHQFRKLAMRWHPDRNPGDASATARFQALGNAFELLTGIELEGMSAAETDHITYQKILHESKVAVPGGGSIGITLSFVASEKSAADWSYAANFAPTGRGAYIATYSGKVIQLSEGGMPVRVYDIGSVPRHIEESGNYLYMLTDTRLYVVEADRLTALVDVFDKGELIIGDTGFGLLENKSFTWFSPTGRSLGAIRSRDPIRRVTSTIDGLLVETRQHRVRVAGAQPWWST